MAERSFAIIVAATGRIASDVRRKPLRALTLELAKGKLAKAIGREPGETDEEVIEDAGLAVVPLNVAYDEAYKGLDTDVGPKLRPCGTSQFRAVVQYIDEQGDSGEIDALWMSRWSHDTQEVPFIPIATAQARLNAFFADGYLERGGMQEIDPASLQAEGYPRKVYCLREGSPPLKQCPMYLIRAEYVEWRQWYKEMFE
jgi:hypothetical protein